MGSATMPRIIGSRLFLLSASSPAVLAVKERYQPGGGDDPVRVLTQLSDFRPVVSPPLK
jgi:hypothetical protein